MRSAVIAIVAALGASPGVADEVSVAVAANFTAAAEALDQVFEAKTGHRLILTFGSTGALYTQITQGAPFQVFLSADQDHAERAIAEGYAVPGTGFTYARGGLVLFSPDPALVTGPETLSAGAFHHLAIADPDTAPYGAAARQVITQLGLAGALEGKLVIGNNIIQAYQFVESGNAELGFLALSQVAQRPDGSRWQVPADLHEPILQGAVLLIPGEASAAAAAFLAFLGSEPARAIIRDFGYETAD